MIMTVSGENMSEILCDYFERKQYYDVDDLVSKLICCSRSDIVSIIKTLPQKEITTATIPQYSSFKDGTINMLKYLRMAGDFGPSFVDIGRHYLESGHNERAYVKYGENHAKLGYLLGITDIRKTDRNRIYLSELGIALEKMSEDIQHDCFIKLAGNIPIIQYAIKNNIDTSEELEKELMKYLAPTTALRRRRNTWYLISALRGDER